MSPLYSGYSIAPQPTQTTSDDFILQAVWSLFAEDLGQLEGHVFTRILDDLISNPKRSSADDLGGLLKWLNKPGPRPPELFRTPATSTAALFDRTRPTCTSILRAPTFGWLASPTGGASSRTSSVRCSRGARTARPSPR